MASRRGYLTQTELAQYADITITDSTEADDQISQAEEMIDAYVGPQPKFRNYFISARAQSGSTNTIQLVSYHSNTQQLNYWVGCEVEILGGSGQSASTRPHITSSSFAGLVTVDSAFTAAIDSTSQYKIYQLGKFPRVQDSYYEGIGNPTSWYFQIPEAVKRAVAAQVAFMITQGKNYFDSDATYMDQEKIDDYMYRRNTTSPTSHLLIAPKSKEYLRGIMNRKGVFLVDNVA